MDTNALVFVVSLGVAFALGAVTANLRPGRAAQYLGRCKPLRTVESTPGVQNVPDAPPVRVETIHRQDADEMAGVLLKAKNYWMDRALTAERAAGWVD